MTLIKELLPIGSVVRLREATKRIMIIGIRQTKVDTNEEFDYLGVLYPEGNLGGNTRILFNHVDLEEVAFRGYEDEEREAFIEKLSAMLDGEVTNEE